MFMTVFIISLFVVMSSSQYLSPIRMAPIQESPLPYQFGFKASDQLGTEWSRQETADANGAVKGSYGYRDGSGIFRNVEYVADDIHGFRANIQSNEPGLISSASADVTYNVNPRK